MILPKLIPLISLSLGLVLMLAPKHYLDRVAKMDVRTGGYIYRKSGLPAAIQFYRILGGAFVLGSIIGLILDNIDLIHGLFH